MCVYSGLHKGLDIHHGNAVMKIILSFVGRAFVYTPLLFVKFVVLFLLLATTKSVSMYFSLRSDFFLLCCIRIHLMVAWILSLLLHYFEI